MSDRTNAGRETETGVSIDDLFEVLSDPENRYVLTYVAASPTAVELGELVAYVVEQTDCPPSLTEAEFTESVHAEFVESALPRLDDVGLVRYDREDETVRATDGTRTAVPHLQLALDEEPPSS